MNSNHNLVYKSIKYSQSNFNKILITLFIFIDLVLLIIRSDHCYHIIDDWLLLCLSIEKPIYKGMSLFLCYIWNKNCTQHWKQTGATKYILYFINKVVLIQKVYFINKVCLKFDSKRKYTCMHTHIHTCTHAHTHTHMHTCTHIL